MPRPSDLLRQRRAVITRIKATPELELTDPAYETHEEVRDFLFQELIEIEKRLAAVVPLSLADCIDKIDLVADIAERDGATFEAGILRQVTAFLTRLEPGGGAASRLTPRHAPGSTRLPAGAHQPRASTEET